MVSEEKDKYNDVSVVIKFAQFLGSLIDRPVVWFRETIVEPNRPEYYWYHEKVRRVPTVDECYEDDYVCIYEAEMQYRLDQKVESQILQILKRRYERCLLDNPHDRADCQDLCKTYDDALTNFFIKYGDLGMKSKAFECYMKQKHRLAWERRHGPVGTGKKEKKEPKKKDVKGSC